MNAVERKNWLNDNCDIINVGEEYGFINVTVRSKIKEFNTVYGGVRLIKVSIRATEDESIKELTDWMKRRMWEWVLYES